MKDYKNSRFQKKIRISEKNLEYIRSIKGKYTLAGKLDEIINQIRNDKKMEQTS